MNCICPKMRLENECCRGKRPPVWDTNRNRNKCYPKVVFGAKIVTFFITKRPNKKGEISNSNYVTGSNFTPFCWVKIQILFIGSVFKFTPVYWVKIQIYPGLLGLWLGWPFCEFWKWKWHYIMDIMDNLDSYQYPSVIKMKWDSKRDKNHGLCLFCWSQSDTSKW